MRGGHRQLDDPTGVRRGGRRQARLNSAIENDLLPQPSQLLLPLPLLLLLSLPRWRLLLLRPRLLLPSPRPFGGLLEPRECHSGMSLGNVTRECHSGMSGPALCWSARRPAAGAVRKRRRSTPHQRSPSVDAGCATGSTRVIESWQIFTGRNGLVASSCVRLVIRGSSAGTRVHRCRWSDPLLLSA